LSVVGKPVREEPTKQEGVKMIDLAELAKIIANILGGVGILAVVIFAAVAYLKQWGVSGKYLTAAAFVVGLAVALVVRYAIAPMHSFSDWVWAGLFGLMAGFLATGAYKGAENAVGKAELSEPTVYLDVDGKTVTGYGKTLR